MYYLAGSFVMRRSGVRVPKLAQIEACLIDRFFVFKPKLYIL